MVESLQLVKNEIKVLLQILLGVICISINYWLVKSPIAIFFSIFFVVFGAFIISNAINKSNFIRTTNLSTWDILKVLAFIFFIGCFVYFPYNLYIKGYEFISILLSSFYLITLFIIICSYFVIYKSKYYRFKIICRLFFYISLTSLLLVASLTATGSFIKKWVEFGFSAAVTDWPNNGVGKIFDILFVFVFPILINNIYMLRYTLENNIVVLRSFTYDDDIQYRNILEKLNEICNKINLNVMYIGNPNRIFNVISDCKCYFLPSIDWQSEVSHLIKEANMVFCYLGVSEGILWELLNHKDAWDKFLFYIDNQSIGICLLEMLNNCDNCKSNTLGSIVKRINVLFDSHEAGIIFIIRENKCYYFYNLLQCIKSVENNDLMNVDNFSFYQPCDEYDMLPISI